MTAWDAVRADGPGACGRSPAAAAPVGGGAGPLSARQRFLLGRRVDVNAAGWEEISGLPGLSDAVARAVVETRRRRGPFARPGDLLAVPGIKAKRLEK
ncbi:MAG: helix-hairpin-helix domain-containing protein, partial [Gemmatimonadota bacterium]